MPVTAIKLGQRDSMLPVVPCSSCGADALTQVRFGGETARFQVAAVRLCAHCARLTLAVLVAMLEGQPRAPRGMGGLRKRALDMLR